MSPYFMKSMTPSSFEAALRQKEGELASYMSRLVRMIIMLNFFFGCIFPWFERGRSKLVGPFNWKKGENGKRKGGKKEK